MSTRALLTLGSNIDPRRHLPAAAAALDRAPGLRLLALSEVWRTPAVGAEGPPFLNAAALIETDLGPDVLKWERLRPIEARLGRVRGEDANAPRTIDIDLALYGTLRVDRPSGSRPLVLPDPEIAARAHLALPLAALCPDWRLPDGRSLAETARRAPGRADCQRLRWSGWPPETVAARVASGARGENVARGASSIPGRGPGS